MQFKTLFAVIALLVSQASAQSLTVSAKPPVYTCLCPPEPDVIHPGDDETKCLDVEGAVFANGTAIQIYDCNGTPAQNWMIQPGSTKVQLNGTNFCMDATNAMVDGAQVHLWWCYPDLAQQSWYYTDDNRIALEDTGKCLDLTEGDKTNGNQVQIWQCTNDNPNQVWTL